MATDYKSAVEGTVKFFQSIMNGKTRGLAAGRNLLKTADFEAMNAEVMGSNLLRKNPERLLSWAATDPRGFDTLRLGIAATIHYHPSEELPAEVRAWLVRFLRGEVKRPATAAGRKGETGLHFFIWGRVRTLVESGMMATRNDASEPTSACDAVAEALAALGLEPATFEGVKRVWLAGKKHEVAGIPYT